jgi:hypothetical protein
VPSYRVSIPDRAQNRVVKKAKSVFLLQSTSNTPMCTRSKAAYMLAKHPYCCGISNFGSSCNRSCFGMEMPCYTKSIFMTKNPPKGWSKSSNLCSASMFLRRCRTGISFSMILHCFQRHVLVAGRGGSLSSRKRILITRQAHRL